MRDFLNDGKCGRETIDEGDRTELRTLIDDWLGAGKNWRRFIARRLKAHRSVGFTSGTFNIPSHTARPVPVHYPAPKATYAEGVFLQFILHPEREQLDGPCRRVNCGRYFLRETAHPKVYCSRACATKDSAVFAMREKREDEFRELKKRVLSAIARYTDNRRQGDWRIYVETETGVTVRTLNGWVKRRFIKAPPTARRRVNQPPRKPTRRR
ncbi:MAG: hypothetical protein WCF30_04010 [Terracidiphilus sp.]